MSNNSQKKIDKHERHKLLRQQRLDKQIYGIVHEPVLPKNVISLNEPPNYLQARRTARYLNGRKGYGRICRYKDPKIFNLDTRCFYTGIVCKPWFSVPDGTNQDSRLHPWKGTRDHLVPLRRNVSTYFVDVSKYNSSLVWCSAIANTTLGLVPLPIKLKIREWLSTSPYDRNDLSTESGMNIRWLIIKYLDFFRINGRYPWSRKYNKEWWYPEYQMPLMDKWQKLEIEFLKLNEEERNKWIDNFVYHF